MRFKQVMSASREMMLGAVFTGIALVIANSWGTFLTTATTKVVNSVRCGKYKSSKDKDVTPLPGKTVVGSTKEACESEITVWGTFWGAIITSIFLTLVVICIMLLKNSHEKTHDTSGTSLENNFDSALYN